MATGKRKGEGKEGAHAGGDGAEPGGKGLVTADVRGEQRTPCAQCVACARPQQSLGTQLHCTLN